MSAKENEEIDKTLKELNKLSKDPEEVAKYEEREWSIMRYDVEMKTNRELGEKEGEIRGLKIGEKRGRIEGENCAMKLIEKLMAKGRMEDCHRVIKDGAYRRQLMQEFNIK